MANHYRVEREQKFALPYFAIAAASTGDAIGMEDFIENLPWSTNSDFDYLLAKAFFAGSRKDSEAAFSLLRRAFFARPDAEYPAFRPMLTEYQYAEAAEWLYEETGELRFLDELLAWVQATQITQPFHSWAYAMEYSYARTDEQRTRALALTLYLDPLSERIIDATPAERERARAWSEANNPFSLLNRASGFALNTAAGEGGKLIQLLLVAGASAVWLVPAYVALHPWFTLICALAVIALLVYTGVPLKLIRRIRGYPSVYAERIAPGDPEMARCIQRSMSEISRLQEGLADGIKQAFVRFRVEPEDGEANYVWAYAYGIDGDFVSVLLDDEQLDVPLEVLDDWMLIDELGRREGGYTHLALARIYRKRYGALPKEFLRELESFVDIRPTEYALL
jgi:hypothetical protein